MSLEVSLEKDTMQVSQGFLHSLIQSSREQLLETRSLDQETDFQEASQLQIREEEQLLKEHGLSLCKKGRIIPWLEVDCGSPGLGGAEG